MTNVVIGQLIVDAPEANSGAPIAVSRGQVVFADTADGGVYRVTGVVTSNGVYASRKVRLIDQKSGRQVRETWSNATTGGYAFNYIRPGTWVVLGLDHTGAYDPEAKADIQSEPM